MGLDPGRTPEKSEIRVVWAGEARPHHTNFTLLVKVRPTSRLIRGGIPHLRQTRTRVYIEERNNFNTLNR